MKNSKYILGLFVLVLVYASVGTAAAPMVTFTFKDIKANAKAQETDTYAINASGAIAGDYVDSAGVQHGMILKGKKLTSFDDKNCPSTPGATAIQMYGINSAGVAVGWCTLASTGYPVGLKYSKGKLAEFSVPKALVTEANGINDKGNIVGAFIDSNGVQHGFLMVGKKVTQLDPPGVTSLAQGWGINNKGVITAFGANSSGTYVSFTTANKGKTYKAFHAPGEGSSGTAIHNINNNGDIVATVFDTAGNRHGVLFHKGKYYTYDDPNGVGSTRGDGLNDTLHMVGRYGSGTYGGIGFEATTKP